MSVTTVTRDYSLVGPEADRAVAAGLASARWYTPPISRAELKELMRRDDGPAIRDTLIWIAAFIVSGGLGYYFWGTWAAVPFFIVYGVLYGSSTDSRWHECGHRTAFKTQWMNDAVYQIACFMIMREPDDLALEPYASPHRYDHRRARSRDHHARVRRTFVSLLLNIFALKSTFVVLSEGLSARDRPPHRRGGDLRARERAVEGVFRRSHLPRHLRPRPHRLLRVSARFCRRCISVCRRSTADGSRSIAA